MSHDIANLEAIETFLDMGAVSAAYDAAKNWFTTANPDEIQALLTCAGILHERPRTGVKRLREVWKRHDRDDIRDVIAAVAPKNSPRRRAEPTPERRDDKSAEELVDYPVKRTCRAEERRAPHHRAEPKHVLDYVLERADVEEGNPSEPQEQPAGYALDYDHASIPALRGTQCRACYIERASREFRARHDDGFCEECRERGMSALPTPQRRPRPVATQEIIHTPKPEPQRTRPLAAADHNERHDPRAIRARCARLISEYPTETARRILRGYWRTVEPRHRHIIAEATAPMFQQTEPATTEADPLTPA